MAKIRNMEEFAALSGISRPTVSKYFNDPDSVRKSTRSRIEEAVERYLAIGPEPARAMFESLYAVIPAALAPQVEEVGDG